MSYSKYQYVITIAETKSISKAAKELYMSQPALTKCINKLEEELGIKLFNRNVIPITLTYAGERFTEEARRILEIQNRLDKEMEDMSNMKKGRLAIGVSASRGEFWLPFILPVFRKKYPGIDLKIIEGNYSYLEEQLEKELIDLTLTASPVMSENVDFTVLTEERILLVASEKHPLVKGLDLSENSLDHLVYIEPARLNNEKFITLLPGQGITRLFHSLFELHNIKPNIVLETQNIDTVFKLACANFGLAFVPETCVSSNFPNWLPAICTIDQIPFTRKTMAMYKKGEYLSSIARAFIEVAKEVLYGDCPQFRRPTQEDFEMARREMLTNNPMKIWFNKVIT
jgi:DNA-binding transcriptional LysR family regulator